MGVNVTEDFPPRETHRFGGEFDKTNPPLAHQIVNGSNGNAQELSDLNFG